MWVHRLRSGLDQLLADLLRVPSEAQLEHIRLGDVRASHMLQEGGDKVAVMWFCGEQQWHHSVPHE